MAEGVFVKFIPEIVGIEVVVVVSIPNGLLIKSTLVIDGVPDVLVT